MSNKYSEILRKNNLHTCFEILASSYKKSEKQATQSFIIDKNKNKLSQYYQYYGYEVCSNHKYAKNRSCHLVQVPICHTTSHGYVVVNTIHGIRLKHFDKISKKSSRHKCEQQKHSTPLVRNIETTTHGKHFNGSAEHCGKLFIILSNQSTEKNNYNKNECNWPQIIRGSCLEITESINTLRKKLNEKKSVINDSCKNCNCFRNVKVVKPSKIIDHDIIYGNARLVLRKHNYGWEKSRLQWLLDLESQNSD